MLPIPKDADPDFLLVVRVEFQNGKRKAEPQTYHGIIPPIRFIPSRECPHQQTARATLDLVPKGLCLKRLSEAIAEAARLFRKQFLEEETEPDLPD